MVSTARTLKNSVSWDMAPCTSCENRRFERVCLLRLHARKNQRARSIWLFVFEENVVILLKLVLYALMHFTRSIESESHLETILSLN